MKTLLMTLLGICASAAGAADTTFQYGAHPDVEVAVAQANYSAAKIAVVMGQCFVKAEKQQCRQTVGEVWVCTARMGAFINTCRPKLKPGTLEREAVEYKRELERLMRSSRVSSAPWP